MLGELSTVAVHVRSYAIVVLFREATAPPSGLTADAPLLVSPPTDAATSVVRLGGTEPVSVARSQSCESTPVPPRPRTWKWPPHGRQSPSPDHRAGTARRVRFLAPLPPRTVGKNGCRHYQTTGPTRWTSASGKSRRSGSSCLVSLQQLLATDANRGRTAQLEVAIQPATYRTEVRSLGVPDRKWFRGPGLLRRALGSEFAFRRPSTSSASHRRSR